MEESRPLAVAVKREASLVGNGVNVPDALASVLVGIEVNDMLMGGTGGIEVDDIFASVLVVWNEVDDMFGGVLVELLAGIEVDDILAGMRVSRGGDNPDILTGALGFF